MQTASSSIWTHIAEFIFYDGNHYAMRIYLINIYKVDLCLSPKKIED